MSLCNAIKTRGLSFVNAEQTYQKQFIFANTQICSVINSKLPGLKQNPPDWNEFLSAHIDAKSVATDWADGICVSLVNCHLLYKTVFRK